MSEERKLGQIISEINEQLPGVTAATSRNPKAIEKARNAATRTTLEGILTDLQEADKIARDKKNIEET